MFANAAATQGGRKRVFLGLLVSSCGAVCLLLALFLILPWIGSNAAWLGPISIGAGAAGIFLLGWLCLTVVFHIHTGRNLPGISGARHLCVKFFLPLMEVAGRLFSIDKNLVRRSFLKVNNEFVLANSKPTPPDKLLLLLPHCMQSSACRRRLGPGLSNCAECGECQIGAVRKLARAYGFHAAIASGGTIARRLVAEIRPERIVAVACERDLTAGIQDSHPIPVLGVLNERPCGPCRDTLAPLPVLEAAIAFFLGKEGGR